MPGEAIDQEIAVHWLAYNLIRANLAAAAQANDKIPRQLSFMAAVQLLGNTVGFCFTLTGTALEPLLDPLLAAIAYTDVGTRKRRDQPRVIKRRPKPYPLMTKPRRDYVTV